MITRLLASFQKVPPEKSSFLVDKSVGDFRHCRLPKTRHLSLAV